MKRDQKRPQPRQHDPKSDNNFSQFYSWKKRNTKRFLKIRQKLTHRKAHHIGVTSLNALDQVHSDSLSSIRSSFIHWFTRLNIAFDLTTGELAHLDARNDNFRDRLANISIARNGENAIASKNRVLLSDEHT